MCRVYQCVSFTVKRKEPLYKRGGNWDELILAKSSRTVTMDRGKTGIDNKTAKRKATGGFPIFPADKPSFFRGFNDESVSRYNSHIIDDEKQLEI